MGMENAPHITKHMLPIPPITTLGNSTAKPPVHAIRFSPILAELARLEKSEVFTRMKTSPEGLSEADAQRRLAEAGPNVIASEKHRGWLWRLLTATRNPLVILLIVLAIISFATGDARAGTVMSLMVILGVSLAFCAGGARRRGGGKTESDDHPDHGGGARWQG
jgi:magnesium-transporting ATPase (P-type)